MAALLANGWVGENSGPVTVLIVFGIIFCLILFIVLVVSFCTAKSWPCFRRAEGRQPAVAMAGVARGGLNYPTSTPQKWKLVRASRAYADTHGGAKGVASKHSRSVSSFSDGSSVDGVGTIFPIVTVPAPARVGRDVTIV
ncbi:hypothetical protein C8Q73DRAFT_792197 [Cubamyces lactineus]|nr:hypothetical protein C8Q73DRAFT_792197 [Cubamyces lactineus]